MSTIGEQIKKLGEIHDELLENVELDCDINEFKDDWAKKINGAMRTIKELSAKLHAAQMERSSQYYCCAPPRLQYNPYEDINEIMIGYRCPIGEFPTGGNTPAWFMNGEYYKNYDAVIAWRPLPTPYAGKEIKDE